jgi:hypothetical protein
MESTQVATQRPLSARQLHDVAVKKAQTPTPQQAELLRRLMQVSVLSAGGGAALGAGRGLYNMLKAKPPLPLGSGSNVPTLLPVSPPVAEENDDLKKLAGENQLQDTLASMLPQPDNQNVLTGGSLPLTLAAAAVPGAAVYKGVRGLFNKFRQSEQQSATELAKKEYEQALAQQYRNVTLNKTAEANEINAGLDAAFEQFSKHADINEFFNKTPLGTNPVNIYGSVATEATGGALGNNPTEGFNSLKGLTVAAMLAAGLGSGKYMYNRAVKTNPEVVMQAALERRSRQRRSVPNVLTPQLMAESQ